MAEVEARERKVNERIGEFLRALERGQGTQGLEDAVITRLTIRFPTEQQPEALLVVKATAGGQEFVGFIGGLDVGQAMLMWRARDGQRGVKWREDVPWGQRGGA